MSQTKKILITSELNRFQKLNDWCLSHSFTPVFLPFIHISPVLGLTIPKTNWIFFSSPQGALAYLNHYPILAQKIAVLGQGTGQTLVPLNLTPEFIGSAGQSPKDIGLAFKAVLDNNETVLFPICKQSKKTVINCLNATQCETLITYKTESRPQKIDGYFDTILFTSPSNVENYLIKNTVDSNTQLIAIGETTATCIRQKLPGHLSLHTLNSPTQEEVISFLNR